MLAVRPTHYIHSRFHSILLLAQVFFLVGLPARTLLETCLRSIEVLSQQGADDLGLHGFVLSSGVHVTLADVEGHELAPLFVALHGIKRRIAAAHPTEADKSGTLYGELNRYI